MKASERLISKVKSVECLRLDAYLDLKGGVWTIGWGHTEGVKKGDRITPEEADRLLKEDLETAEGAVNGLGLTLTQNQFDALTDFAFNAGVGALRKSTLLKRIREGADLLVIQSEFRRWVYAAGKKRQSLVERREWEAQLYGE